MEQKYPIVMVHCTDQSYYGGTYDPRIKEFEPVEIIIVGHLIHNDPEKIVVASEYCSDHDIRYVHVLPWAGIDKVERLKTAEEIVREQKQD